MRIPLIAILAAASLTAPVFASDEAAKASKRLDDAALLVSEMMGAQDKGIPQELFDKAQCAVLVPSLKKAGFILGGKYGKGFVVCRKPGGGWGAPAAIRIEGGSIGFQIGFSETDVIMLVMNESGARKLQESKFTLGADASVAAGPVGRSATADTDATMHAEILSWSRSHGVFAGVALQGATLRPDDEDNRDLYGRAITNKEILAGGVAPPPAAAKLHAELNRYSMHKEHGD
jgi:lipid-binding SYLF domain-containing protein